MSENFHNKIYYHQTDRPRDEVTHYAGNTQQKPLTRTPDGGQQMGDQRAWLHVANSLRAEYDHYGPEEFERRHGVSWEEVSKMVTDALDNAPTSPFYMAPPRNMRDR